MAATEVYYTITTSRLDAQMRQIDQLDTKVATTFTMASVILAFFAGLLTLAAFPANHDIRVVDFIIMGLAIMVYLFLAFSLYKAYQVTDWSFQPNITDLENYYTEYSEEGMKQWVADACIASIRVNNPRILQKTARLNAALLAFACESGLIALAGAISLLGK